MVCHARGHDTITPLWVVVGGFLGFCEWAVVGGFLGFCGWFCGWVWVRGPVTQAVPSTGSTGHIDGFLPIRVFLAQPFQSTNGSSIGLPRASFACFSSWVFESRSFAAWASTSVLDHPILCRSQRGLEVSPQDHFLVGALQHNRHVGRGLERSTLPLGLCLGSRSELVRRPRHGATLCQRSERKKVSTSSAVLVIGDGGQFCTRSSSSHTACLRSETRSRM